MGRCRVSRWLCAARARLQRGAGEPRRGEKRDPMTKTERRRASETERRRATAQAHSDGLAVKCSVCGARPGAPCVATRWSDNGRQVHRFRRYENHAQRLPGSLR